MTKNKIRIDICCHSHKYQVERGEFEAMTLYKQIMRAVPAMTIYKPPSPQAQPDKGVLFHNHQKVHGKNIPAISLDRARVLQMNPPYG
jgi:hypothetical protein